MVVPNVRLEVSSVRKWRSRLVAGRDVPFSPVAVVAACRYL